MSSAAALNPTLQAAPYKIRNSDPVVSGERRRGAPAKVAWRPMESAATPVAPKRVEEPSYITVQDIGIKENVGPH